MIEILLVHTKAISSYTIRMVTCSKWSHVAIRLGNRVIEANRHGIVEVDYDEWCSEYDRIVLPMTPDCNIYPEKIIALIGQRYGFADLYERLKEIKAERWDGRDDYVYKEHNGYICSDLGSIFIGSEEMLLPSDFPKHRLLIAGKEYTTVKGKKLSVTA